jgi:hypothetical protein
VIEYVLPKREQVVLDVYDVRGRRLERLVQGVQEPGQHSIKFNASKYSSGVYFYRLRAGDRVETKKMAVVK